MTLFVQSRAFRAQSATLVAGLLVVLSWPATAQVVEPSMDGTFTLNSISTLGGAGSLVMSRPELKYIDSSSTFDIDRPPLLADSGGMVGGEDTSEFSAAISNCTQTNLPNYDPAEPPCRSIEIGDMRPTVLQDATIDAPAKRTTPLGNGQHVRMTVTIGRPLHLPLFRGIPIGSDMLAVVSELIGLEIAWEHIDFMASVIPTSDSQVIKAGYAKKLIAGSPGSLFSMKLAITFDYQQDGNNSNNYFEREYFVARDLIVEPVALYHTHKVSGTGSEVLSGAPQADLRDIEDVKIHYNAAIPCAAISSHCLTPPTNPTVPDTRTVWIDTEGMLSARNAEGLIVLEYRHDALPALPADLIGFEIVQIKSDEADSESFVHVGSRLKPVSYSEEGQAKAIVRAGGTGAAPLLIYQHGLLVLDAQQAGQVWAVHANDTPRDMEVMWTRLGLADVEWPFEYRQYTSDWPESEPDKYQLYAAPSPGSAVPAARVNIPTALNPELIVYDHVDPAHDSWLASESGEFYTDGSGWSLLRYKDSTSPTPGKDFVGFEVVRSVSRDDPLFFDLQEVPVDIGTEIWDPWHEGTGLQERPYIHIDEFDSGYRSQRFAEGVYNETGQVFAVNTDGPPLEVWWMNLSRTDDLYWPDHPPRPAALRIPWPSKVARYRPSWASGSEKIVIASGTGTGALAETTYGGDWVLYGVGNGPKQDPSKPGFNPNDEHAMELPVGGERGVFALRDDLGTPATSEPFVLVQYREQTGSGLWRFKIFEVVREEAPDLLHYDRVAGQPLGYPFPLGTLQMDICTDTRAKSGPFFEDRKGTFWAMAAANDGTSADIVMEYYYPVQPGFFFPTSSPEVGSCVPWLDDLFGDPADVAYTVTWPEVAPSLFVGQTVIDAEGDPPVETLDGQCSAEIIYQQSVANGGGPSASVIDPVREREVDLPVLPEGIGTPGAAGKTVFPGLPPALAERVSWNGQTMRLSFRGLRVGLPGLDYVLPNIMSAREFADLQALSPDAAWRAAVQELYDATDEPVVIGDSGEDAELLALSAGFAQGTGYVTLAVQNSCANVNAAITLRIVQVVPELYRGKLAKAFTPTCPFDETQTVRHQGDFGGRPEVYEFQWRSVPDLNDGEAPAVPVSDSDSKWFVFTPEPSNGFGALDVTFGGPGLFTLSDNWFVTRYRYVGAEDLPWKDQWSPWTEPQLAEGWIKRVVGELGPYKQRATGGGIEGAEDSFFDYGVKEVNTIVDMITQAGPRWEGSVPLSCKNIDDFGLIEIYETVLNRGIDFSIAVGVKDYDPVNTALLLAAGRIADLYVLLGNEAYADVSDPTIAFGTDDQNYGAEASSIWAFRGVTSSLIEEELALLRGRDDSVSPPVTERPFYNRLFPNFTNDISGGEVAYALNYNIRDQNGDVQIDWADALARYPQGHGDAWGHYLTALKAYYRLLRHPNYAWVPRAEALSVGSFTATVDYFDERKFAAAAAARARTGSELVNLTYRAAYVEDPEGQMQGYADPRSERAWGLSEWSSRAGQGAYFDWVVGNAILPDVHPRSCSQPTIDPLDCLVGVQDIDRGTVPELAEVASRSREIQAQLDAADLGLNPLGLATNTVPFDINAVQVEAGKTHFEQIYDRAVTAMNGAIAVFDHANNSTQLLRRQADSLVEFQQVIEDTENDFNNRLIEIYGYPYGDDIGAGGTYADGYEGPDLYHYTYVDASDVLGLDSAPVTELDLDFEELEVAADGTVSRTTRAVTFHISSSANRYGLIKPPDWTKERRAPGEIQLARSDLLRERARFEQALLAYDLEMRSIEDQAMLLRAQYDLDGDEIKVLNAGLGRQQSLNERIANSRSKQLNFRKKARNATLVGNAMAEMLPLSFGFSTDVTSFLRGAIKLVGSAMAEGFTQDADVESLAELDHQQALGELQAADQITLASQRSEYAILQALKALEQKVRGEAAQRINLYVAQEVLAQASGRYLAALAKGERLQADLDRFRRRTAVDVQTRRYKDMAFRIFRNDALQKYRAQFDLAARYVYLAAKAYDFETTMLSDDEEDADSIAGSSFLSDIVRKRLIGKITGGMPQTGKGLADAMARMSMNFESIKGNLGFNTPDEETKRFSLRHELFRYQRGAAGNEAWREKLSQYRVPDLNALPEFRQHARFGSGVEPGIVIPFSTTIERGLNFFGWPLGPGDHHYNYENFATKVRSLGVWFSNYNSLALSEDVYVYLIPVGSDVLRDATDTDGRTREFRILDQNLPAPFEMDGEGEVPTSPSWIPGLEAGIDFGDIRRYNPFLAYHDSGDFDPDEVQRSSSRAIGRSVWNTRWLLVIPGSDMLNDGNDALDRFISGTSGDDGVSDILIFFETYSYSGN